MKTCEYCAHFCLWRNDQGLVQSRRGLMGDCRRHSPAMIPAKKPTSSGAPMASTKWPAVSEHDFCGDWQAREVPVPVTLPLLASNAPALRSDACG